jgi:hypothetical protein
VANVGFFSVLDMLEPHGVGVVKAMAEVGLQAKPVSQRRRMVQTFRQSHLFPGQAAFGHLMTPSACVKLNGMSPKLCRSFDGIVFRFDEQADQDTAVFESCDFGFQVAGLTFDIQSTFGGPLFTLFWNERDSVRHDLLGDADHFLCSAHFKVKRDFDRLFQGEDIPVLDVTAILSEVASDVVGTRELAKHSRLHWIRISFTPRLTHGSDVINVDAKANQFFFPAGVVAAADADC